MEGIKQQRVWAPDLMDGYRIGVIEDFGVDHLTVRLLSAPERVKLLFCSFIIMVLHFAFISFRYVVRSGAIQRCISRYRRWCW